MSTDTLSLSHLLAIHAVLLLQVILFLKRSMLRDWLPLSGVLRTGFFGWSQTVPLHGNSK